MLEFSLIILLHSNSEVLKLHSEIDSEKQDFRSLSDFGSLNQERSHAKKGCYPIKLSAQTNVE